MRMNRARLEDILLAGLLVFAPLAFGSVNVWAYCAVALAALLLFDLRFLADPVLLKKVSRKKVSIGIFLFLAVNLLYIIPLPMGLIRRISPAAFDLKAGYMLSPGSWEPLSVYPRATITYILKLCAYIMVFLSVLSKLVSAAPVRKVLGLHGVVEEDVDRAKLREERVKADIFFLGAVTGILSILLHSAFDFNLHIPANAGYFTVLLAIAAGSAWKGRSSEFDLAFLKKLVDWIVTIGFCIAVYAILKELSLSGRFAIKLIHLQGRPLHVFKKWYNSFGPYVNHNHFAGFMEMCLFIAMGRFFGELVVSPFYRIKRIKDRIVWLSTPEANKMLMLLFAMIVMAVSLFLSFSRGGIISFFAAAAVFYFVFVTSVRRHRRKVLAIAAFITLVLILVMIVWIGPDRTLERFGLLEDVVNSLMSGKRVFGEIRPRIWGDTFRMIGKFPITGTGLGTFSYVFPNYRTFPSDTGFVRYAHNDYLQLMSETGIIGTIFVLGFFVWYVRKFRECARRLRER